MQTNPHQQEIDQIHRHIKYLSIVGGIALTFLFVGGHLLMSDYDEAPVQTSDITETLVTNQTLDDQLSNSNIQSQLANNVAELVAVNSEESSPANLEVLKPEATVLNKEGMKQQPLSKSQFKDDLLDFKVTCESGNMNVSFVTSGLRADVFEIEKSTDRTNFTVVSRIPQKQVKEGENHYSHIFECSDNKDIYFRVKKTKDSGKVEYSQIAMAACTKAPSVNTNIDVYPIGYGSFKILINSPDVDHFTVTLTDSEKREIATDGFDVYNGSNEFVLKSGSIPRGSYTLRVSNGTIVSEKMVFLK